MKNFIPYPDKCKLRLGSEDWATGFTAGKEIETLVVFQPSGSGAKMFAATDQGLYDVTSNGAIGAVSSAATNARWQWVNFANSSTNWVCLVNGTDDFRYYNGSTWTTVATFGSLATNTLIGIEVYQQRLFFVQKDSKLLHYLPTGAVTGTAGVTALNVEQHMKLGGYVMAIGTWTLDAGTGMDDNLVVVTSEGQVIVFRGTDPSSASTWAHVGTYFIGRPIGRRCLTKMGGDLVVLTERGLFPLSQVMQSTTIEATTALSRNIEPDIVTQAKSYFSTFGWQVETYPRDQLLILNVPQATDSIQYVMQLQTRGWCRFEGLAANCWATFGGELYFGTEAKVMKAQSGSADNGSAIEGEVEYAYSRVDGSTRSKLPVMLLPLLSTSGPVAYSVGVSADFRQTANFQTVTATSSSPGAIWDTGIWDASSYGGGLETVRSWTTIPAKEGSLLSPLIRVSSNTFEVAWIGAQMLYKQGTLLA
jgi:hypothetical protein